MSSVTKAVIVACVATLGLIGCARGPASLATAERVKALESKMAKVEEDFRSAAAARDNFRQRLAAVEDQRVKLEKEVARLQVVLHERDDLRKEVTARITERDALQGQFDQLRKGIKELLGQADTAAAPVQNQPVTSVATSAPPGKS